MARRLCISLLLLGAAATISHAQDDARVNAAIDKGVAYLKTRQDTKDGAFRGTWFGKDYKSGETALTLLALLKGGVKPNAPQINAGFAWLMAQPPKRIYCVSVAILALEARYTPEAKASIKDDDPLKSQIRKRFKRKAPPKVRQWLANRVAFLEAHQDPTGMWRYPFFGDADLSNAQFAVLALKAAERMGARVNKEVYLKIAECLIKSQEPGGPEVASFPVPAADRPIAGLLDRRARRKAKRSRRKKKRRKGKGTRERGPTLEASAPTRTRTTLYARGWGYKPGEGPRGSMTAAGLAVLVVCKSVLEGNPHYDSQVAPKVDQALRDGAAWISARFRVDRNPGAENDWLFYYLYTLERAGTLLALNTFGGHDWYQEGAQAILAAQQADGRFYVGTGGEQDGDLAATCFAVLFLERSTVPVIKRPKTGGGASYGPKQGGGTVTASGLPLIERKPDGSVSVTFRFKTTPGRSVTLAGSFNGWSKDANRLQDTGGGDYSLTLSLPSGRHTYKFVIDGGEWRQDPQNAKGEPDGHGGQNSVIE